MRFKIGDKVTPNPNTESSLRYHIGEIFTVVRVRAHPNGEIAVDVDRPSTHDTSCGWREDVWILAKNHIVSEILKDL